MRFLRIDENSPYGQLIGIGGLGTGIFFAIAGDQTLGRNESRAGRLLDVKDYCKLHIVLHYVAKLLGARHSGHPFHVVPFGCVGNDPAGNSVVEEMASIGIDTSHVRTSLTEPTLFSVCFQYPDGSGGNITSNNSAASALDGRDVTEITDWVGPNRDRLLALAVPEVPLEVRRQFLETTSKAGAFCVGSFVAAEVSAARSLGMFQNLNLAALNASEAEQLVGRSFYVESPETFLRDCQSLLKSTYPQLRMVISAGSRGAYAVTSETHEFCAAPQVNVRSTAGAGDSLLGGILAAIAAGVPLMGCDRGKSNVESNGITNALQFGVLIASYKCQSPHTISHTASVDTLIEFAKQRGMFFAPGIESLFVPSLNSHFSGSKSE